MTPRVRAFARWLAALCINDILEPLNDALEYAQLMPDKIASSADQLTSLLFDIPSRHVDYELQRLRHEDPEIRRDRGDLDDLAALSVAVPYCDVVVTEKMWTHLIKRSNLSGKYNTLVLRRLDDLVGVVY